jgi:glucokinase
MILAGDVGGTNTRLGLFAVERDRLVLRKEGDFSNRGRAHLGEILEAFLKSHALKAEVACLGVAGPVKNARVETTNLPWIVDAHELAQRLGIKRVWLLNDLEANAYGIGALSPSDLVQLNQGTGDLQGNQAVISAGTGLGEAGLCWDGKAHIPFGTEGGHTDFAPTDDLQMDLLRHLRKKYGHVSSERVLSGPGLVEIYTFLRDVAHVGEPSSALALELEGSDPAAAVSKAGLTGSCPVAVKALDLFVEVYGSAAGNLGLKMLAIGGVYLGGGIAPKIIEKLRGPRFMESFVDKGRMRRLLASMPVSVIMNEKTALLGAAHCAALRTPLIPRSGP